ncbi:uncharacterized protein LOC131879478 [Tigriopus californicus]|uniref:uncharacterized protein LOC131879478 n=1 Tax=Tigriopus californicus TaxID=6832 RepID=UPI0027D9F896|nr:uncharacterized protein LOC131879478 [Tigriopus californicus]|eukprot:TCALIF_05263-PA protein Name:"Protein of unknown function" AED:0.00 eAED:0.00 QI:124/1/1/1/1/1/2/108/316
MLRLCIYTFFLYGYIVCMENPEIYLNELRKDLVTDPNELQLQPKVPSLYKLAQLDSMLLGSLVQTKFSSKEELESIHPVQIVVGKIIGGPFSMKQAIRVAGIEVIKRIFGHESSTQGTNRRKTMVKRSVGNDLDTVDTKAVDSAPVRSKRQNHEEPLSKLSGEASYDLFSNQIPWWKPPRRNRSSIPPKTLDEPFLHVDHAFGVDNPIRTLFYLNRFPELVKGKVIAGDTKEITLISDRELKDINQAWIRGKIPHFGRSSSSNMRKNPFQRPKAKDQTSESIRSRESVKDLDLGEGYFPQKRSDDSITFVPGEENL